MKKTHGEVQHINGKRVASPEYRSWQMMKNRCLNPKGYDYAYYGGRGIKVCKKWLHFEAFLEDMGRRPSALHTLERKNGDGHYTPRNCVWATRQAQARNRAYASTRIWEVAAALDITENTARHYLWALRREEKGVASRYTVPPRAAKLIKQHMGKKL
jgi:hypothetical protein